MLYILIDIFLVIQSIEFGSLSLFIVKGGDRVYRKMVELIEGCFWLIYMACEMERGTCNFLSRKREYASIIYWVIEESFFFLPYLSKIS